MKKKIIPPAKIIIKNAAANCNAYVSISFSSIDEEITPKIMCSMCARLGFGQIFIVLPGEVSDL